MKRIQSPCGYGYVEVETMGATVSVTAGVNVAGQDEIRTCLSPEAAVALAQAILDAAEAAKGQS